MRRMDASQRAALETDRKTRMKMNVPIRLGLMAAAIVAGAALPVLVLATHGSNVPAAAPVQSHAGATETAS
jgi:hypothetical protein